MIFLKSKIKYQLIFIWLIFLTVAFIFFGRILGNFFVSDDFHWLQLSQETQWSWRFFLTNYEGGNLGGSYNPLLLVIFKIFYAGFGLKYFCYHLASIVLQATNAFLVYVLARQLFHSFELKQFKNWSFLAGFLFLIWPTQVESVAWVSAWPHLWMTLFYLCSLTVYFYFHQMRRWPILVLSILFFIIALLIKEVAISLPLVILIWEIYFFSVAQRNQVSDKKKPKFFLFYLLILLFFMIGRYQSTGLLFGYYAQAHFELSIIGWIGNLAGYINELVSVGHWRGLFFKLEYYYLDSVVIMFLTILSLYFFYLFTKFKWFQFTLLVSLFFSLGPVMALMLHRFTFSGERYLYLPAVFFVLWLIFLLARIKLADKLKLALMAIIFFSCFIIIQQKISIWQESSRLSQQIVESYADLNLSAGQELISVGLPDNLSGAEVFRNNLQQALEFYYPANHPQIKPLPVYTQLSLDNINTSLLKWRQDALGWFAESINGGYVVTGQTSIVFNEVYFELWNYNYQNYTANVIRLIPKEELKDKIINQEVYWLTFDQGRLKLVN
ncbi:MAG: hypothetical protein COV55_01885 [Candidatus Komeilibacteria bacterium CG11_big_fil_rev_8_21_14_0_20_36_20]|uniref:Glycosyltransferase RgtA/B/C/D-like domain-containing protein n=1 Tax=Candidatus Komeilibacteria bacterium CG11_big_fil_rev_8_21_14_0_20_36_20 TaxID=1974477 RepID=A0A2H0NE38_9BACT|nr:MAG: hypothetical protein COV55_01885 [Candidatus Komeilibacteria bacterium CG11_big_fil_rev_8_21_14_0_20_36_20]PIR81289.1 MAG: hypothetical protein COU21_04870 [Candidatus Komeilibacteria bacterium CG10_big_fil_rev_8_21_14_0_10_36_65]PJC55253.1 MAG: hypothetical protein CO027_03810 [Candidatus Komeilibacteria bacterium CG_4_9_14_0_2_um_filter_36_13]